MTKRSQVVLVTSVLLLVALLLQSVLLNRVGFAPDLVALVVIAVGLATSPTIGAVLGFVAGMLLDILPPDLTTLGATALTLTLVGYGAGVVRDPRGLAPVQLGAIVFALTWAAGFVHVCLAALLSDRVVMWPSAIGTVTLTAALTSLVGLLLLPYLVQKLMSILGLRRPRSRLKRSGELTMSGHE